ncbi:MAG: DUF6335 family protein [Leptolyngbyaceae cyanobacterium]
MSTEDNQFVDGKGAVAGEPEPMPEKDTIDRLADNAGLDIDVEEPVTVKKDFDARDENRWELDADSSQPGL